MRFVLELTVADDILIEIQADSRQKRNKRGLGSLRETQNRARWAPSSETWGSNKSSGSSAVEQFVVDARFVEALLPIAPISNYTTCVTPAAAASAASASVARA